MQLPKIILLIISWVVGGNEEEVLFWWLIGIEKVVVALNKLIIVLYLC